MKKKKIYLIDIYNFACKKIIKSNKKKIEDLYENRTLPTVADLEIT